MPLLLRPTAPSPSIDELVFAASVAPFSLQTSQRAVSLALSECPTHGQLSQHRRRSTASAEVDLNGVLNDTIKKSKQHLACRVSQPSLRCSSGLTKVKGTVDMDANLRDLKLSAHESQLDDDNLFTDGSCASEVERNSSLMSCSCSCADANEFAISSSSIVIEDCQLAVVEKELLDLRKTLLRKLCSRLTKLTTLARRKSISKPIH
ncbi:uncharacterized protein PHALS_04299 [Plasmopara halstedii]|uniref:Uncharacterized protein n=1 Tax=Plasmopara halstedii TaxID=4781 RepID=A0A0P1B0X8_PLAHL|nr:uncharacterized protein PHALS_04299 [Plasmopara halstedii]CEG47424.1 hypothetical protein PHALS_04299 [Plasmopara halstedii]|eukprot:XP_024583793.1 hypothetical protein PHALS_04299 [Plasmopara halstedii]